MRHLAVVAGHGQGGGHGDDAGAVARPVVPVVAGGWRGGRGAGSRRESAELGQGDARGLGQAVELALER